MTLSLDKVNVMYLHTYLLNYNHLQDSYKHCGKCYTKHDNNISIIRVINKIDENIINGVNRYRNEVIKCWEKFLTSIHPSTIQPVLPGTSFHIIIYVSWNLTVTHVGNNFRFS